MRCTPLVSVIIPSYNVQEYIKKSVLSVLSQTFQDFEILIVNDGSTDNTLGVIEKNFSDTRIKVISQENQGLAGARNSGIKNAQGKFVALLDADDEWLPQKLETQIKQIKNNPQISVFSTNAYNVDGNKIVGTRYNSKKIFDDKSVFSGVVKNYFKNKCRYSFHMPSSMLVRKSLFDKHGLYDSNLKQGEDSDIIIRWALSGEHFYFEGKPLVKYQISNMNSLTKNLLQWSEYNFIYWINSEKKYDIPKNLKYVFHQSRRKTLLRGNILKLLIFGLNEKAREKLKYHKDILLCKEWRLFYILSFLPISKIRNIYKKYKL